MNGKMIDVNIHWNYLFFTVQYTDDKKLRCATDHINDFELTITQ